MLAGGQIRQQLLLKRVADSTGRGEELERLADGGHETVYQGHSQRATQLRLSTGLKPTELTGSAEFQFEGAIGRLGEVAGDGQQRLRSKVQNPAVRSADLQLADSRCASGKGRPAAPVKEDPGACRVANRRGKRGIIHRPIDARAAA